MERNDKFILLGLLAAGALWVYTKGRALASLVFYPGSVTGISLTGGAPNLSITVIAQNTSTADLQINSFAGNVFCDNTLIGNVSDFQPFTIFANSQTPIPLVCSLNPIDLVNEIVRAFNANSIQKTVLVQGYANVNGNQLPISLSFTIG